MCLKKQQGTVQFVDPRPHHKAAVPYLPAAAAMRRLSLCAAGACRHVPDLNVSRSGPTGALFSSRAQTQSAKCIAAHCDLAMTQALAAAAKRRLRLLCGAHSHKQQRGQQLQLSLCVQGSSTQHPEFASVDLLLAVPRPWPLLWALHEKQAEMQTPCVADTVLSAQAHVLAGGMVS